jgi:hypothetical protein
MKRTLLTTALYASLCVVGLAQTNTSSIDPTYPASGDEISSFGLRQNFAAAHSDINKLFGQVNLPPLGANQLLLSLVPGVPSGYTVPDCSASSSALTYESGEGFGCHSISSPASVNVTAGNAGIVISPTPGTSAFTVGLASSSAPTNEFANGIDGFGNITYAQPRFSNLGGMVSIGQLPESGVSAGSYTNPTITVDASGRVTSASNGSDGGGSSSLSSLTPSTTGNSFDNVAFPQTWTWNGLTTQTAVTVSTSSATSGELLNVSMNAAGNTGYAGFFSNNSSSGFAGFFQGIAKIVGRLIAPIVGAQQTNINVTLAPYNASGFRALTQISGTVSSGSFSIPVTSSAGFSAGQIAVVALAGTSGTHDFCGFISSVPDATHIVFSSTAATGGSLLPTCTGGTTGTQNAVSSSNFVYSFGSTTLSSSVTNGATSIPVSNAATYQIGQGVLITGGAASGVNLVTTITAVSGNSLTISPGISNSSGVASGANVQHDETAAIQLAVNQLSATQNVTLFFPDGVYQVNGPAQETGTANTAILFPSFTYYTAGYATFFPQVNLTMTGNQGVSRTETYDDVSGAMPTWSGAIIFSQISGYNVFNAYTTGGIENFTNIFWNVKNMLFRSYPNSNQVTLNGNNVAIMQVDQVTIDDGRSSQDTAPTNSGDWAIKLPAGQNNGNIWVTNTTIDNRYHGLESNEHTTLEHVIFVANEVPVLLDGTGANYYGSVARDIIFNGCAHGVEVGSNVTSGVVDIDYTMVNIEHLGPVSNVDDINDSGNKISGFFSTDNNYFGGVNATVVGAANLHVVSAQAPSYPLPMQVNADLSNSHYTSAPNGMMLYCSDCTIANPCAGSGTGALAKRLNGAWVCN